jgi:polyribonucleotide nucleotidyltransferase
MGLIKVDDRFAVLSDIAGQEDHHGDMDFKVAGTADGVTALQMDIKIAGVDREIMNQALAQARRGRLHILEIMEQALGAPRPEMSPYAPRMTTISIPSEKIRDVIGPGGKTIRAIQEETGCEIEIDKDGRVTISSSSGVASARAREIIESLTEMPEVGKNYIGKVRRVEAYGAFVEIIPGTEGLLHVSELAPYRVREVTDVVREGDEIEVKVIEIDPDAGRIRLSRKAVIMEAPDYDPAQYAGMGEPEPERGPREGDRGGRPGGDRRGGRPGGGGGRPGGGGFRGRR